MARRRSPQPSAQIAGIELLDAAFARRHPPRNAQPDRVSALRREDRNSLCRTVRAGSSDRTSRRSRSARPAARDVSNRPEPYSRRSPPRRSPPPDGRSGSQTRNGESPLPPASATVPKSQVSVSKHSAGVCAREGNKLIINKMESIQTGNRLIIEDSMRRTKIHFFYFLREIFGGKYILLYICTTKRGKSDLGCDESSPNGNRPAVGNVLRNA